MKCALEAHSPTLVVREVENWDHDSHLDVEWLCRRASMDVCETRRCGHIHCVVCSCENTWCPVRLVNQLLLDDRRNDVVDEVCRCHTAEAYAGFSRAVQRDAEDPELREGRFIMKSERVCPMTADSQ